MGVLCCRSMAYELHTALQNFMRLFIFPCAGNVGLPPLNLYARVRIFLCTLHTRPRVQRASGIPCALSFERRALLANLGRNAPREREFMFTVIARSSCDEAIHSFFTRRNGLLRGACHRARIRATRWLAMTKREAGPKGPYPSALSFSAACGAK